MRQSVDRIKTGKNMQQLAELKGITKDDISRSCGVTIGAVNRWFSGKGLPSIQHLINLSIALEVGIDSLLIGN